MFDFSKDLKVYTSAKYVEATAFVACGVKSGEYYHFEAHIKVGSSTDRWGNSNPIFKVLTAKANPDSLRDFSDRFGAGRHFDGQAFHFLKTNPTKTWNDFITGTDGVVAIEAERIDEYLQSSNPTQAMQKLMFDERSLLAAIMLKIGYRHRRTAVDDRERARVLAWVLYGVEIQRSATVGEFKDAIKQLPPTDFGILNVDKLAVFMTELQSWRPLSSGHISVLARQFDALVADSNGKQVMRPKRPRSEMMAQAWDTLNNIIRPAPAPEVVP